VAKLLLSSASASASTGDRGHSATTFLQHPMPRRTEGAAGPAGDASRWRSRILRGLTRRARWFENRARKVLSSMA